MNEQTPVAKRKKTFFSPQFVQAMLAGHSALGLAFAALIYIVCISGTVAVFVHEFSRWEQPNTPLVSAPLTPEAIDAAVKAGYAQALADNGAHDMFLMAHGAVGPRFLVNYHDHETNVEGHWIADGEGRLVARQDIPWTEFIASLHMNLHLPRTWGMFLVGLTGVALLASLISGLLSHPRLFKDAFALRWGGSRRLQEADLHNRLGVWGLPFHVAVSTTGALLGLSTLIVGILALAAYDGDSEKAFSTILGPLASADETAAPVPDIAQMIRAVQSEKPDAVFASLQIGHVGKAGQVVHLGMRTPGHLAMANTYYFDGTGKPLGDGGLESGGIGQQILGAIQPLHFGWFGGLPIKLIYGVLGLALTVVTQTGVTIWLARRRDKGKPSPGLERVWSAVVWGQPLAFATTAIAALVDGERSLLGVYLATMAAAFVVAKVASDAAATTRTLRIATSLALLGTVAVYMARYTSIVTDPMAWFISIGFVLCAAVIAAPCFRYRQTGARAAKI